MRWFLLFMSWLIFLKIIVFVKLGCLEKRVGFCPSGILSRWDFIRWDFVLVGFCPVGFCPFTVDYMFWTHSLLKCVREIKQIFHPIYNPFVKQTVTDNAQLFPRYNYFPSSVRGNNCAQLFPRWGLFPPNTGTIQKKGLVRMRYVN